MDSGAAQSGVSLKWVQQNYPELLAQIEPSPQRFNGLTGDELYVEGVVKLPMLMGTTKILVYAHVFTNMHEDLLIGINGMVENSIIVDPAGHKTFVSGDATSQVDLSISKGGALELKLDGEVHETIAATIARPQKRARFTVSSDEHILNVYQDTVIEPAAESGQQAVLLSLPMPVLTSAEAHWWASPLQSFLREYPHLQFADAVVNNANTVCMLPVTNTSDAAITIPAGTRLATVSPYRASEYMAMNENILTFDVVRSEPEEPVDEAELTRRGLDLTDCRDTSRPGAPKLTAEQHKQLVDVFISEEAAIARDLSSQHTHAPLPPWRCQARRVGGRAACVGCTDWDPNSYIYARLLSVIFQLHDKYE
jgi:hypothetical protein